jgi:hypothetical protein
MEQLWYLLSIQLMNEQSWQETYGGHLVQILPKSTKHKKSKVVL